MPNAMVFTPGHFYLGCSEQGKVWQWECDLEQADPSKILSNHRLFVEIAKPAVPDGMTADAEGNLYLAVFNGFVSSDIRGLRSLTREG